MPWSSTTSGQFAQLHDQHCKPDAADPLADVLDWLGRTRYDMRESSRPHTDIATLSEDPAMSDICEESPQRGGPAHTHGTRQLRPKLEKTQDAIGLRRRDAGTPTGGATGSTDDSRPRPSSASDDKPAACSAAKCLVNSSEHQVTRSLVDEEEEEWEMRQRKSGTVGRLVVYNKGERPKEDIVLRGGGSRRHIVVAHIREGGQASRKGVRAGDRLVSIDGRKDFLGLPADAVRERLCAPTVLVFLGFVGKLQAEVRLTNADHICGVSARREVLRGSQEAPVTLCEEHVFNVGLASLFLTVKEDHAEESVDSDRPEDGGSPTSQREKSQALFELQRSEALGLVRRAMRRLEVDKAECALPADAQSRNQPDSETSSPLGRECTWPG